MMWFLSFVKILKYQLKSDKLIRSIYLRKDLFMKKILCLLFLLPSLCFSSGQAINKMILFGDSLSDTGNLYRITSHLFPKEPPYFKGHFSNGHIWAEKLYKNLFPTRNDFDDYNYAVGGASAVLSTDAMLPYTLSNEVNNYLYFHSLHDKSKVLYVIWIGGNNYLRGPTDHNYITDKVIDAITYQMEKLIDKGAKHFMVPNLPDLATTPYGVEHGTSEQLGILSKMHNHKLHDKLIEFRENHPDVTVLSFDVESIFKRYYNHPEKVDIKYIHKPCLKGDFVSLSETFIKQHQANWLASQIEQAGLSLSPKQQQSLLSNPVLDEVSRNSSLFNQGLETQDCHDYLFFDRIHPTHKVHDLLAGFAIEAVKKSGLEFEK